MIIKSKIILIDRVGNFYTYPTMINKTQMCFKILTIIYTE